MIGIEINHPVLQEYVVDGIACPIEIETFKNLVHHKIITAGTNSKKVKNVVCLVRLLSINRSLDHEQ